ncbi:helix-turn-helix transcriptional regulator [Yersinia pseudotuberculosis]|uniref:helix-turn-helix transcriptional regulator n=1 Tax=Yersinia pseudotuberculosis TaxID=633 RepID=UPI00039B2B8F|nr:transcriptional regulator [Yersinia pseudotuberculosis]KGA58618.1 HTH domain protein [Yersinia pseudotuberculosis]CNE58445.1 YheO domain-containing protein [Yersinia pseudotuberculosis]CQH14784.1 YheO domain-containing protein [Yersinia pseudotuberculosis]
MTQDEIIKSWIPMVEFIARTYGENCEVILHDLRDLDKSIVAIKNNHITGRQIGGTITDFALKLIHEKSWEERDFIINYKGRIPGKSENIRASTFFIKDEEGEIIAMLCMNVDLTSLSLAHKIIGNLMFIEEDNKNDEEVLRNTSITDMLHELITDVLNNYPRAPSLLIMDEKKEIVKKLNEKGVFLLKGAVAEVAMRLETSEQTIYRYLK